MFSEEEIGPWTSSLWQLIRCGISEDVKDIRMPIKYKNTRLTWETAWFFSLMLILGIFLLFPQLHLAECSVWRECTAPVWAGVALWMSWCSCRWGKGFLLVHQECQRAAPAVGQNCPGLTVRCQECSYRYGSPYLQKHGRRGGAVSDYFCLIFLLKIEFTMLFSSLSHHPYFFFSLLEWAILSSFIFGI